MDAEERRGWRRLLTWDLKDLMFYPVRRGCKDAEERRGWRRLPTWDSKDFLFCPVRRGCKAAEERRQIFLVVTFLLTNKLISTATHATT